MFKRIRKLLTSQSKPVQQIIPAAFSGLILMAIFVLTAMVDPGWASWLVSAFALLIIAITALARLKDITLMGWQWQVRRIGLILVGAGAVMVAIAPLMEETFAWPTWRGCIIFWGFALTWLTTPSMPPWHKYISGEYKLKKGQQG